MKLENKVALITGSGSGIGEGIAEMYAKEGAKIVICDLTLSKAESVANKIKEKYKAATLAIEMDVSDENQVEKGIEKTIETFGSIDILNANAGIQTICPFVEFDHAKWNKLLQIHINGSFFTAQRCMKQMMQQKSGGKIIFTGSVHSFIPSKEKAAYITAKHAQMGMMRAIALEGAPYNICANLIAPGFVKTPLVEKQIPEQAKALKISEEEVVKKVMLGNTFDGQFTTIEEVAIASLFFATFPTSAISGQSLIISHGWVLN